MTSSVDNRLLRNDLTISGLTSSDLEDWTIEGVSSEIVEQTASTRVREWRIPSSDANTRFLRLQVQPNG